MFRILSFLAISGCFFFWFLLSGINLNPFNFCSGSLAKIVEEQEKSRQIEAKMATIKEFREMRSQIERNLADTQIPLLEAAALFRDTIDFAELEVAYQVVLAKLYPGVSYEEALCWYLI